MILADGLVLGLALGLATGGSLAQLELSRFRLAPVFAVALAIQLVAPRLLVGQLGSNHMLWIAWILPAAVSTAVAALNISQPGVRVIFVGLMMNLMVVVLNAGMPVMLDSVLSLGGDMQAALASVEQSWLHVAAGSTTRLLILADVIPVYGPGWHRAVVSLGDVLLSAGVGAFVFVGLHNDRTT